MITSYLETKANSVIYNFILASGMSLLIFYHSHDLEISPKVKMGFWSWITYFNEDIKGHIVDD